MAQDTRKDPRAKVLSMTVRYKSATVDEFIEHHSHDVSRGGIFIKTPSPFPPGTFCCAPIDSIATRSVTLLPAPAFPTHGYSSRLFGGISPPGSEGFSS